MSEHTTVYLHLPLGSALPNAPLGASCQGVRDNWNKQILDTCVLYFSKHGRWARHYCGVNARISSEMCLWQWGTGLLAEARSSSGPR